MGSFFEFIDKKQREAKRHLKIIKKLLESSGIKVADHLKEDDPYIFAFNPQQNILFDGIRIYQIGSILAFRVQKEEKTHPFGKAYALPIEDMFDDLLEDNHNPEHAGKKLVESVAHEIKQFFVKSVEAEKELRDAEVKTGDDAMGKIVIRSNPNDYSNLIYSKG